MGSALNRQAGRFARVAVMLIAGYCFLIPLVWLFLAPTKTRSQLASDHPLSFGSLDNIALAWQHLMSYNDGVILLWVVNSIEYSAISTLLGVLACVPAGYGLAVYDFRGRRALLLLTLLSMITPGTVLIVPLFLEMDALGLVGSMWAVVLPTAYFPFGTYLAYLHYVDGAPKALLESARIDGAGEWSVFWRIGLPLGRPVVALICFFCFVGSWNNFFLAYIMLGDDRDFPLQLGLTALLRGTGAIQAAPISNLPIHQPEAALAGIITIAPILFMFMFAQRFLVQGLRMGAEKE